MPPVNIESIDCDRLLLTVNSDSLVGAKLIRAKESVRESELLFVVASNNLNYVRVGLFDRADSVYVCVQIEGHLSGLTPAKFLVEVMFGDHILVLLKPKAHFLLFI